MSQYLGQGSIRGQWEHPCPGHWLLWTPWAPTPGSWGHQGHVTAGKVGSLGALGDMGTRGALGDMGMSPWPHLVELDRAEDVNAFGEELLDVAEQVGVHGGTGDGDTRTVRDIGPVTYLRKPGNVGAGTEGLSGDTGMETLRCSEDAGMVRRYWDSLGTQRQEHEDGQWMWRQSGNVGMVKDTETRQLRDARHLGIVRGYWDSQGERGDGWDIRGS